MLVSGSHLHDGLGLGLGEVVTAAWQVPESAAALDACSRGTSCLDAHVLRLLPVITWCVSTRAARLLGLLVKECSAGLVCCAERISIGAAVASLLFCMQSPCCDCKSCCTATELTTCHFCQ
jgi:hypothetical protein